MVKIGGKFGEGNNVQSGACVKNAVVVKILKSEDGLLNHKPYQFMNEKLLSWVRSRGTIGRDNKSSQLFSVILTAKCSTIEL